MSTTNSEGSTNPEHNLTPAEIESLDRLEAVARDGLGTYVGVGAALAEIRDRHLYRDSHPSFAAYVRERWGGNVPAGDSQAVASKPCEALARACEETLSALADGDRMGVEIRLAVRRRDDAGAPGEERRFDAPKVTEPIDYELVPMLRWLLTQASGTVGEVGYQLETRAADIDDRARAQLRDDVLVLDGELAVVKALLIELIDWDSDFGRLLGDQLPPHGTDADPEDDE